MCLSVCVSVSVCVCVCVCVCLCVDLCNLAVMITHPTVFVPPPPASCSTFSGFARCHSLTTNTSLRAMVRLPTCAEDDTFVCVLCVVCCVLCVVWCVVCVVCVLCVLCPPLFRFLIHTLPSLPPLCALHSAAARVAAAGWVWAMDPSKDFVSAEKRSYLRREVIIWGDR